MKMLTDELINDGFHNETVLLQYSDHEEQVIRPIKVYDDRDYALCVINDVYYLAEYCDDEEIFIIDMDNQF